MRPSIHPAPLPRTGRRLAVAMALALAALTGCGDEPTVEATAPTGGAGTPGEVAGPAVSSTAPEPAPDEPIEMPDLVGLGEAEARRELDELGMAEPVIETRESLDAAGTVLDQVPSAGRVASGTVTLVVAEAIEPMPDFQGVGLAEVRRWADDRSVDLQVETSVISDEDPGTVLQQIPAKGAEVGSQIQVTVAETPRTVDLAKLEPVDYTRYAVGNIDMNGGGYQAVGVFDLYGTESWAAFNLSRDWEQLDMTLGLDDFGPLDAEVEVRFVGDGQVLHTTTVTFGRMESVEVDVSGVLRLQIVATRLAGSQTNLGLGSGRLIGSADEGSDEMTDDGRTEHDDDGR